MNGSSKSRTYIAMCNRPRFDGYYFKRFLLPERDRNGDPVENSSTSASWWFLNRIDFIACIEGCFAAEDLGLAADLVPFCS